MQPALAAAATQLAHARAKQEAEGEGAQEEDDGGGAVATVGARGAEQGHRVEEDDEEADFKCEPVPAVVALPPTRVNEREVSAPQQQG
jgi:hypothetical protein